jgi:hypothetical protein
MSRFAMLITYREVFDREPHLDELHSMLTKYARREVVAFLGKLNCLLGTWKNTPQTELDAKLSNFILGRHRQRLEAIRKGPIDRIVFSRLTLLYVLKQACLACPEEGLDLTTEPSKNDLGVCCLMANDLVLPFIPSPSDNILRKLSNILPFCDYVSLDHYPMEIARTQMILEDIVQLPAIKERPDFIDLANLFNERFKISATTFCELVFGCATKSLDVSPEKLESAPEALVLRDTYFQHSKVPPESVAQFFRKVAITEAELASRIRESQNRPGDDLTLLQQFPMIEIVQGRFLCLDPGFLVEKAGTGFYWALFSEVSPNLRDKLPGFWGSVFETYVNSVLGQSYAGFGRFIPEPRFENGDASFDACIVEGRDLIVFEHKSSVIRADAKYGGDVTKLENQLRLKFVEGDKDEPKGVTQLSRNLSRFLGGDKLGGVLEAKDISRVYPVLVCLEGSVVVPYMARYFRDQFKEIYPRKKYPQVVTPLFTLGITDVENLLGFLAMFKLSEILESYYSNNKAMLSPISSSDVPLLKNVRPGKNLVKDRFSEFAERMVKNLFGEEAALEATKPKKQG